MYNTPNLSTMGLSAAAIPLTLSNALLQLALGFAIIVTYLLLVRRTGGLHTRDFSNSNEQSLSSQQCGVSRGVSRGVSERAAEAEPRTSPAQFLNNHDEVICHDHHR